MNVDEIISPAKYHRSLDGTSLAIARQELGLSQTQFAELCSWSRGYQAQLERGENEILLTTAEKIIKILSELNLERAGK
jgi:transcriptional regulator with XRE-family HTH domain